MCINLFQIDSRLQTLSQDLIGTLNAAATVMLSLQFTTIVNSTMKSCTPTLDERPPIGESPSTTLAASHAWHMARFGLIGSKADVKG